MLGIIYVSLLSKERSTDEFRKYDHPCAKFGENADPYMAAAGHFGCQSKHLSRTMLII
mgnify:CR=1 FL=1